MRRPRPRLRERVEQPHPDLVRAGEHDAVDAGVVLERLADRVARAHDEVDRALGNAGLDVGHHQVDRRERRRARRLEDDRVAAEQGGSRRAAGQGHREVERADDGEDAVRPEHGPGVDRGVAEVAHRVVVAVVVLHRLRVVAQEVGGLLDLAERLDPVLADLDRHVGGVRHQVVADVLGRATDDGDALAPGHRGPRRLGGTRCGDRLVDVRRGGGRERPEEQVPIDRRARLERLGAIAPLAVDVVLVLPAELRPCRRHGRLEACVQLLVVGAQGRVGDLDARLGLGRHGGGPRAVGRGSGRLRSV